MRRYSSDNVLDEPSAAHTLRTDAQGRCGLESFYECMFPTMFYSFDAERGLAGIRICEAIGDLMEPQVIRLVPARWVTGEVASSELADYGLTSSYYCVQLYPANPINGRELRQQGKNPRFRFLVPPGEYAMSLQGEHLEFRRRVKVFVPPGIAAGRRPDVRSLWRQRVFAVPHRSAGTDRCGRRVPIPRHVGVGSSVETAGGPIAAAGRVRDRIRRGLSWRPVGTK